MASWHQAKNLSGLQGLWAPHETEWKCVSDKVGQFASSMTFQSRELAEAYCRKTGDVLIPPRKIS